MNKHSQEITTERSHKEISEKLTALEAALTLVIEKLPALETVARLTEALVNLPSALAVQAATMSRPTVKPGDPVWLKVAEAAERGGLSQCFIYRMIKQNRLHVEGRRNSYRIWRNHFDEQLSLGWPVLNVADPVEAGRRARGAAPAAARIPRPKRPSFFNNPSPKLV